MKIGDRVYAKRDISGGWSDDIILAGTWGTITEIDRIDHLSLNITVLFDGIYNSNRLAYVSEDELGY